MHARMIPFSKHSPFSVALTPVRHGRGSEEATAGWIRIEALGGRMRCDIWTEPIARAVERRISRKSAGQVASLAAVLVLVLWWVGYWVVLRWYKLDAKSLNRAP